MPEPTKTFDFQSTEEIVGASLVFDFALLDEVEILPEYFLSAKIRLLVKCILYLKENDIPIDFSTVLSEFERRGILEQFGGAVYLTELLRMGRSSFLVVPLVNSLIDAHHRRTIQDISSKLAGGTYDPTNETSDLIDTAVAALNAIGETDSNNLHTAQDGAMSVLSKAQLYSNDPLAAGEVRGYATGYIDINAAMGGWQKGTVTYILADEHIGKTWLMLNLIIKHHENNPNARSILFSLEMSADTSLDPVKSTLWERIICSMANISTTKYKAGTLDQEQWYRLNEAVSTISTWDLNIIDNVRNMSEIERICRYESRKAPLTMVCVDYLKLVIGAKGRNRNEEIGELTRRFQWLCRQIDAFFLIPQQVGGKKLQSRRDKRPNLSDGYESGHISQDADGVIGVYRDELYNDATEFPNIMEINFLKDRVGQATGKRVYLFFNKHTGKISAASTSMIP